MANDWRTAWALAVLWEMDDEALWEYRWGLHVGFDFLNAN